MYLMGKIYGDDCVETHQFINELMIYRTWVSLIQWICTV